MIEIKKISKIYKTEGFEQTALDNVSINFRKQEFAAVLGPSGSGKTTFLNIIGGLDRYTSGDLIINGKSTKKFKDRDWDSYRNHRVGFIFQSYNLISHQSVLKNVELALTLSGISKSERKKRAIKALTDVGLLKHIHKKPSQLSGGQMQRVAIARALINDPEIILADEPTGALDSETSVQIMELLKKISLNKLVIMVTHNPDLAKDYATRIINIKDGKIISDTNPYDGKKEELIEEKDKIKKTKMSFLTALSLSFNNLMTKKARTILIAVAGSIGIIGIALILAVSTGFQNYVDSIQEETLTSYPLTIQEEATDITGALLSLTGGDADVDNENEVKEQQYISSMLTTISANDLKSFKKYVEDNYDKIANDIANIKYFYSVDPNIYTIDVNKEIVKINPNDLFTTVIGNSTITDSYSKMLSVFTQMVDKREEIEKDYDVLAGRWPEAYNEMIIVLSEPNAISDLLVYCLGLRDMDELTEIITNVMGGNPVNVNNEPMTFTYDDLLNLDLRLVLAADTYKYNTKYDVYEDMTDDEEFMKKIYNDATKLKIVGVVSPKEGVTSTALNPGISYTSGLIDYIIENTKDKEIVKKQLENKEIDIFSGNKFDRDKNDYDFKFADLIKVDNEKLQSAFNISIDKSTIENETKGYLEEINKVITTDITPAREAFSNNLNTFTQGIFASIGEEFNLTESDNIVDKYLSSDDVSKLLSDLETKFVIPKDTFKIAYSGLIKGLLQGYITGYNTYMSSLNPDYVEEENIPVIDELKDVVLKAYLSSAPVTGTVEKMAHSMTEALMKKTVLTKIGELTNNLTSHLATSFSVDEDKIASAFSLNFTEDELIRVIDAMMSKTKTTQKSNLITLGYQDKEEPTYISYYFNSFDGKERFLSFIDEYNKSVDKEKEIDYSDATGILMSSVKTIVNAVSYVLIAFVSISLVVSSIMIGVITYISVYERTKEIGILRAMGASKGNISSIFNAETFIIGLLSGLFGIGISYVFIPIINGILHHFTGNIPLSAYLDPVSALLLIILSIILTLIGGIIPARAASKKDPVEALRSE